MKAKTKTKTKEKDQEKEKQAFLDYLKEEDIKITHPFVSKCTECLHCENEADPCPKVNRCEDLPLVEGQLIKTGIPPFHCIHWRMAPAKKYELYDAEKIPTNLAEIEYEPEFENILPEDNFISRYLTLYTNLDDAFPEYHFAGAISVIANTIQRKLLIKLSSGDCYTNIWSLFIGDSTEARKSTAHDRIKKILRTEEFNYLQDDWGSMAGFLEEIGDISKRNEEANIDDPTNVYYWIDELSIAFNKIRDREPAARSTLIGLNNCPDIYRKRLSKKKIIEINKLYMNWTGTIQPEILAGCCDQIDITSGFIARFLMVFPTRLKDTKPERHLIPEEIEKEKELRIITTRLLAAFDHIQPLLIEFSQNTLDYYNEWAEIFAKILDGDPDQYLFGSIVGRLKQYAKKLAVIFKVANTYKTIPFLTMISNEHPRAHVTEEEREELNRLRDEEGYSEYELKELREEKNKIENRPHFIIEQEYMFFAIRYIETLFFPSAIRMVRNFTLYGKENNMNLIYEHILHNQGISRPRILSYFSKRNINSITFDYAMDTLLESKRIKGKGKTKSEIKYYAIKEKK